MQVLNTLHKDKDKDKMHPSNGFGLELELDGKGKRVKMHIFYIPDIFQNIKALPPGVKHYDLSYKIV